MNQKKITLQIQSILGRKEKRLCSMSQKLSKYVCWETVWSMGDRSICILYIGQTVDTGSLPLTKSCMCHVIITVCGKLRNTKWKKWHNFHDHQQADSNFSRDKIHSDIISLLFHKKQTNRAVTSYTKQKLHHL